jgi:RNA polymerase sigma factor for flagellar operon FliA
MPGVLDYEDIVSHGTIGLIEALDRYDENKAVKFETYAMARIRGSIIDALRALDRLPRSVRQKARQLERARSSMTAELAREPTSGELAKALGMTAAEYARAAVDCGWTTVSLDGLLDPDQSGEPAWAVGEGRGPGLGDFSEGLERLEMTAALASAIGLLPERERLIVSLYYKEGLTRKEIGRVLDISESRVCQLHARALSRLRARLEPERAA